MEFLLMLLIGIPIVGVFSAVVVQLRSEAPDRRLENQVGPAWPSSTWTATSTPRRRPTRRSSPAAATASGY